MTIYHAEREEIVPHLDSGSIELVLTDPDYNAGVMGTRRMEYATAMPRQTDETYQQWCAAWFAAMQRVTRRLVFTPGVAKDLGRKAILIERVERYCEIAANRMAQAALIVG